MRVYKDNLFFLLALGGMPLPSQAQFWSPVVLDDTGVVLESQNSTAASFIGSAAQKQPLQAKPRFSPDVLGFHQDGGNSRTNDWAGPLGNSPQVGSRSISINAQFWHDDGRFTARTVCTNGTSAYSCMAALDPDTFDVLGSWSPEGGQTLLSPYGTATNNLFLVSTYEGHIMEVERIDGDSTSSFNLLRNINVAAELPQGHFPSSSYKDEDGNIWFTANCFVVNGAVEESSLVGYVNKAGVIHTLRLDYQRFENAIAVNGKTLYVNTGPLLATDGNGYMWAFQVGTDGEITTVWSDQYSAGTGINAGGISQGSGSSPSLVGNKYVAITDNSDVQVNLVIYRQAEDYQKNVAEGGKSFVCQVPLFQANASANENAMIGYYDGTTYTVIANNHYSAPLIQSQLSDDAINGDFNNFGSMGAGITRVDITEDGECSVSWSTPVLSTSPLSLSTGNGLVYTYTQDNDLAKEGTYVWYFTALDFRTGEIVWRVRSGVGGNYNNNLASTQLAPNGGLYQLVYGGITWLKDA